MRNFGNADAFICGVHGCKLLVAHLNRAETQAIIGNFFIVAAIRTACHKIRDNACIGIAFVKALFEIAELLTVPINDV